MKPNARLKLYFIYVYSPDIQDYKREINSDNKFYLQL